MVYKLPKEAIADNELEASQLASNLVNSFVPIGGILMCLVLLQKQQH